MPVLVRVGASDVALACGDLCVLAGAASTAIGMWMVFESRWLCQQMLCRDLLGRVITACSPGGRRLVEDLSTSRRRSEPRWRPA